jgi:hypothetical protein
MEAIDKLTLELLTNKTQYKKYLAKEDPQGSQKQQDYLGKIKKYRSKILTLSKEFLENPEKLFNNEMNEMFKIYAKTAIKYIEMREVERENLFNKDDFEEEEEDDEILFDSERMDSDMEENSINSPKNQIIDIFSLETTIPRLNKDI